MPSTEPDHSPASRSPAAAGDAVTETFDYVVVGAGSAGAAVARRLAEDGSTRVAVLEAGAARHRDFWVRVPLGIGRLLLDPQYVWPFHTEPQTSLKGQPIYWPRGRLPGGSSSVNGMIWVRGDPAEYDRWRDAGNRGWGWSDLLPLFRRLEAAACGADEVRGRDGPIRVTALERTLRNPLGDAFVAACEQVGIARTDDYNGGRYEGVGYLQLSTGRGRRWSTAIGYLGEDAPATLRLATEAVATRVLFDGRRAVGVEYRQGGRVLRALARAEVILSAGPIKSPQLLELSGVGRPAVLERLGLPQVHALPGVGENLVDHLQSRISFECADAVSMNGIVVSRVRRTLMGARWLLTGGGWMATPGATVHALVRTAPDDPQPDVKIQLHHITGRDRYARDPARGLDPFPGFSIGLFPLRPTSRGSLWPRSADPLEDPAIDPRYLDTEADRRCALRALRLAQRVADAAPMRAFVRRRTRPAPETGEDDDALLDYLKTSGQTSWHPVGTCRMGRDPMAVVDDRLRVHGLQRLRVVDSSVMPTMPSSNTNAASILIGEKAADLIREDRRAGGLRVVGEEQTA
jgi:choline dehydrogenase